MGRKHAAKLGQLAGGRIASGQGAAEALAKTTQNSGGSDDQAVGRAARAGLASVGLAAGGLGEESVVPAGLVASPERILESKSSVWTPSVPTIVALFGRRWKRL